MNKFLNWIHHLAGDERGTIVLAVIFQGSLANASHIVDVSATATADQTATIPHGLGATPTEIDLERAEAAFERAVRLRPDYTNARNGLQRVRAMRGPAGGARRSP